MMTSHPALHSDSVAGVTQEEQTDIDAHAQEQLQPLKQCRLNKIILWLHFVTSHFVSIAWCKGWLMERSCELTDFVIQLCVGKDTLPEVVLQIITSMLWVMQTRVLLVLRSNQTLIHSTLQFKTILIHYYWQ